MASGDSSGQKKAGREGKADSYSIGELASLANTTPRTIRYYLVEGLLPAPSMRGRYAAYSRDHLNRLRLIQRLKDAFLPLSAIRAQLARLTPDQIALLADGNVHLLPDGADEAAQYLARLLEVRKSAPATAPARPKKALWIRSAKSARTADSGKAEGEGASPETWQRYCLSEGVELHVRDGVHISDLEEKLDGIRRILTDGAD